MATQSSGPTPTPNPALCGAIPSGTTGTVLFFSDLTDRCAALGNYEDADVAATHATNGYLVRLKIGPGLESTGGPVIGQYASAPPADVRVEFDAEVTSGHAQLGIACHRLERGRMFTEYHLVVGTDGTYGIEGGPPYRSLAAGTAMGALRAGVNHIRSDCIGTTLTLYVNGEQIATAQDSQLSGRLNGFFLRSLDAAGAAVTVHNLLITTP